MKGHFFMLTAGLCAALLTAAGGQGPPANPCAVQAQIIGGPNMAGLYHLRMSLPQSCPKDREVLTRLITPNGGRVPPVGYFKMGSGLPDALDRWTLKYTRVEERLRPNVWANVPIRGAIWQKQGP